MIWLNGYPKDNGASDCMDSSRLAGLMSLVGHPLTPNLSGYFIGTDPIRCPMEAKASDIDTFSRDQLICLASGLFAQGKTEICKVLYYRLLKKKRAPNWKNDDGTHKLFGGDILLPHDLNHLRLCAGLSINPIGEFFLKLAIIFNSLFTPMREQNQLICMCILAGSDYVEYYKRLTPLWREALGDYWCGWRNEPELCELIIKKVELL